MLPRFVAAARRFVCWCSAINFLPPYTIFSCKTCVVPVRLLCLVIPYYSTARLVPYHIYVLAFCWFFRTLHVSCFATLDDARCCLFELRYLLFTTTRHSFPTVVPIFIFKSVTLPTYLQTVFCAALPTYAYSFHTTLLLPITVLTVLLFASAVNLPFLSLLVCGAYSTYLLYIAYGCLITWFSRLYA